MMAASTSRPPQLSVRPHSPGSMATTQTQTQSPTLASSIRAPVLRLRGASSREASGRRISWADDVVDNEGLGRKKSKVCCIYHAPKPVVESSDESSSDDSHSDDSDNDDSSQQRRYGHDHRPSESCSGHGKAAATKKGQKRARSPNAYEKMPKVKTPNSGSASSSKGI